MSTALTLHEKRAAAATAGRYWLPTRPYTLVDAVNRAAAATGSFRNAQLSADANYNGHAVQVTYNSYRDYCVCEHYWGGRVVHCRGTMEEALRAGCREYDLGHRGTSVITDPLTPAEAESAVALGYKPWSKEAAEAWHSTWCSELYTCVHDAIRDATTHLLLQASDKIDYEERCKRLHADRLFGANQWQEYRLVGPTGQRAMMLSGNHTKTARAYALVVIDGISKFSGPAAKAEEEWKKLVAAGWGTPGAGEGEVQQ